MTISPVLGGMQSQFAQNLLRQCCHVLKGIVSHVIRDPSPDVILSADSLMTTYPEDQARMIPCVRSSLQRLAPFLPGTAFYLIALAFQVSGLKNALLTILFAALGTVALLLAFLVVSPAFRIRLVMAPKNPKERLVRIVTANRAELYKSASEFLRSTSFSQLQIYAPTGIWEARQGDSKWLWFRTIASCLVNAQPKPRNRLEEQDLDELATSSLGSFWGVFGLPAPPQRPASGDAVDALQYKRELKKFADELGQIEAVLHVFDGIDTAQLRYLETDVSTIPGMGAVLFDTQAVTLGLAVDGRYQLGYSYTIIGDAEIGDQMQRWFLSHVFALAQDNVLQDMAKKITLTNGFAELKSRYGISHGRLSVHS